MHGVAEWIQGKGSPAVAYGGELGRSLEETLAGNSLGRKDRNSWQNLAVIR
jgi:hypothetical protein